MSEPNEDQDLVPPRLQGDLRALFGRRLQVPGSIGAQLRHAASTRRGPRLRPMWVSAAAAALIAIAGIFLLQRGSSSLPVAREDFDGNGRIDVLDAYRLALAIGRHERVAATFDLDGSGVVDRRDADLIAARAVRIGG